MSGKWFIRSIALIGLLGNASTPCQAAPPWEAIGTLKYVEADPEKPYVLKEDNGPWLIMASSFSGEGAEKQAHELVLELRKRYKLPAYIYKGHFDLGQAEGRGTDPYGKPRKFKYLKQDKSHVEVNEVAVLVGDYASVDDSEAQKVLQKIKSAEPPCLDIKDGKVTHQTLTGWRMIQKQVYESMVGQKKKEGPMGHAFIVPNPLLPPEFFASKRGLDADVLAMNEGVPFSLLDCPGKYTVQVATFKGRVIIKQDEIREIEEGRKEMDSMLAQAAEKADKLTKALRAKGYDAYQFHDRAASIVTVGCFNSVGTPRSDGRTEINPQIHLLMKVFAAKTTTLPGQTTPVTQLQTVVGIPLDVQPLPVMVPKRSISVAMRRDTE